MVLAALIHSGRLFAAHQRAGTRGYDAATSGLDVDLTHLLMSFAMATMLVTDLGAGMSPGSSAGHGGHAGHGVQAGLFPGGSISSVAVISVLLVGTLLMVAAQQSRQLRAAVVSDRAWSMPGGGLLLAPGLGLVCQLAMSGAMIYMLVLMV